MYIQFFSGTHWDREWYQDFQGFRMRLVKMADKLIDGLENEDYGVFHFDGQTIFLEDYLEIRPENEDRLKKLIKSGKIMIGPWYDMPDEFLLSGESLIKNLKKGFKISRKFGAEPLKYGYICDIFGHIAQMPQIFKGFGINHALLGRGTNESTTPMHFNWQAPDGSSVTAFKLFDDEGYGGFTAAIGRDDSVIENLSKEELKERIKKYADYEINRANIPVVIMMDALDHINFHKDTKLYLDILKELYPDAEVSHESVMEMCKRLDEYADKLPVKTGELREPGKVRANYIHMITNTMSSRYPIKKFNDRVQALSEKIIAPMYAFDMVDIPIRYLELADKYLLQNHPHDSICCCGIDKIYKDMEYRFSQAEEILKNVRDEYLRNVCNGASGEYIAVKVYNPLPYKYSGGLKIEIAFPKNYREKYCEPFGYEDINSFKIYDSNEREIPYTVSDIKTNYLKRIYNQNTELVDLYRIVFDGELIPMGITEFIVKPYENSSRYLEKMTQGENWAENDYLRVEIDKNGSVNLLDKARNIRYNDLLDIVDDGEIGDGWYHVNPVNDYSVSGGSYYVKKVLAAVDRAVFEIHHSMHVPFGMKKEKYGINRSEHNVSLEFVHRITLQKNAKFIDVKTTVNNTAKDHRVRLKLSSGIENSTYYASQPFYFAKRNTDVDINTQDWNECDVPEKQMSGIVLKKGKDNALAFVSAYGLHECAVTGRGDIYITLYRCFSNTVMDIDVPNAQLLEKMEFSYRIVPCGNDIKFAELQKMQDAMSVGLTYTQCECDAISENQPIMEILGDNIVYSTSARENGGAIIRICNESDVESIAKVAFNKNYEICNTVDFDQNVLSEEKIDNRLVSINLKPWEIRTLFVS